ncbi:MAG: PAS domain S-box protein [Clostridia bacterium]
MVTAENNSLLRKRVMARRKRSGSIPHGTTGKLTRVEGGAEEPFLEGSPTINILLVDDRPENLLALEAILSSPEYRLVSVHSGEEALRQVLKEDFSLILLDVQMPGLNGFETAKLIKSRQKSEHIPIIFITAISQATDHVLHGYAVGAIDYIFKPFHPEALKRKIDGFIKLNQRTIELEIANNKLKMITDELKKAEALARIISETSADAIITMSQNGIVLAANPAVESMFGYSPGEVVGRHVRHFLDEADTFEKCRLGIDTLASNGSDSDEIGSIFEAWFRRKDGSAFPGDIQIGHSSVGNQLVFVCSIRDITERKRIEQERKAQYSRMEQLVAERTIDLRRSEERFRKIFDASPSMISIRSLADKRYIDVNESWLDATGYKREEVIDKTREVLKVLFKPEEGEAANRVFEAEEAVHNAKICYYTKSGAVREGLLSTEIIDIHGEKCSLIVITDITEQVHLEKEMARLDRLNLIGEMAAGIAHEIRNPMTTVRGFLQMSKSMPEVPMVEYVDLMVTELDRANEIITEFLTLAKNRTTNRHPQNLNAIIDALHPLIQAEALLSDKHVFLELHHCPHILLDEKEIRQLVLNLALNGLEAMEQGGSLNIRTYPEKNEVVLEISDQGSGIKEEFMEKIGTPFFTTKAQGTGLGLAVCYSVAARHNASIQLETSEKGTTFYVRFQAIK